MDKLFLQIINMSITSSYVILLVIVVRLFLKKVPKIFSYGLWGIGFFRLIFPLSFESIFSLISINTKTIPENIAYTQVPQIQSGITAIDGAVNRVLPTPVAGASVNPMQIWISIGSVIWVAGLIVLLIYSLFTTSRLSKNLKSATLLYDNIYEINTIKTPFVFGLLSPKIYLPNNLSKTEESYIIKHEQTHIKRNDHIIKFVAFLIVSIHWFNPIVWIAFYLMGEDMELSCDEAVIKEMGYGIKRDYSNSLLSLSVGKRIIGGSPIAFGENNTKSRIKNILNYKKPKFWVTIAAIIVIIALAIGLLSNPPDDGNMYKIDEAKVIEIRKQIFPNGSIEKLDHSIWFDLIHKINNVKWNDLSEENWPHEDDIALNITITLARDESVDNKEYILGIYRNKDKNVLGKEHEYSLALAYNDLTDGIKVWGLPQDLYYKIRDILGLSDKEVTLEDNASILDDKARKKMTVEDYAWQYIDKEIEMYENAEWGDFKFTDKEITKLEKLSTFDNILPSPVELWMLDFRLKPESLEGVVLAGGLDIVDGWLIDYGITGKPHLTFTYENGNLIYLGNANAIEFDLDTLASQETAIRIMLENMGLLPNETYEGKHVVIKFPLSTGETSQLLLSQPIIKGTNGIWAVERWMDGNGNIYHVNPHPKTDIKIEDYYKDLQEQSDNGHNRGLLDPIEVGYDYILNSLGQVLVKVDDLVVTNPATIKEYYFEPNVSIIEGTLITRMYYGPPNYGENPDTDAKQYPFILQLDDPIDVIAQEGDIHNSNIFEVTEIQVVPMNKEQTELVEQYINKRTTIQGTLFGAIFGGHHTDVLIEVEKILD